TQAYPPDDVRPAKKQKPAVPERTWTDRTGKFSVKARFQEVKGDNIVLAKADGKTIEVPLAKLSDADAGYVKGVTEASDNPFVESATSVAAASDASGPTNKANWHDAKQIRPQTFTKWSFTPSSG